MNFESELIELIINNQIKYYKLAFKYMKNEEDSKDVIQESITKALRYVKKLENNDYLDTWFCKIIINTSLTFIKKNKKVIPLFEDKEVEDTKVLNTDLNMDLENAIKYLTDKEQLLIHYKYYEDLTFKDISNITGINENSIKTTIYKSLNKMKKYFM